MEALETVDIDSAKVLQIIRSLDCNKAHGWDDISIAMLKICDYAVVGIRTKTPRTKPQDINLPGQKAPRQKPPRTNFVNHKTFLS